MWSKIITTFSSLSLLSLSILSLPHYQKRTNSVADNFSILSWSCLCFLSAPLSLNTLILQAHLWKCCGELEFDGSMWNVSISNRSNAPFSPPVKFTTRCIKQVAMFTCSCSYLFPDHVFLLQTLLRGSSLWMPEWPVAEDSKEMISHWMIAHSFVHQTIHRNTCYLHDYTCKHKKKTWQISLSSTTSFLHRY